MPDVPRAVPSFHCPRCHVLMDFVSAKGEPPEATLVYRCPLHGEWVLAPKMDFHQEPARSA